MPFHWALQVGLFLFSSVVSYATRQTPDPPKPAGRAEFTVPNSEIGVELWEIYGTVRVSDPSVAWDGDFATAPIKKKGGKK